MGHPITFSAWLDRQKGRKLFIEGECADGERADGDNIVTCCHSLFIIAPGVPFVSVLRRTRPVLGTRGGY